MVYCGGSSYDGRRESDRSRSKRLDNSGRGRSDREVPLLDERYGPGELRVLASTRALTELARAAEEAGFDGLSFDDHPAPPRRRRADPGGHDCFDPFVALAAVEAGTTSLRLFTSLAVLPYRNPLLLAKITPRWTSCLAAGLSRAWVPGTCRTRPQLSASTSLVRPFDAEADVADSYCSWSRKVQIRMASK
ncbi:LLM class flavin-dependent oxidoreductase [Nocardia sp. NPDC047654]|uniref:LLM class flavin-dependent oxidoreductase n=1 Tax=Nocardia sp. NPDC047654 TaxID=3364314 RepID=UPI003724021A